MSDKMREEFEVAYQAACLSRAVARFDPSVFAKDHCDDYLNSLVQSAWWGWKASREALVIELPEPYAVIGDYAACGGGRSVWDVEYAEKITDRMCAKTPVYDLTSLEAAGLKVKP